MNLSTILSQIYLKIILAIARDESGRKFSGLRQERMASKFGPIHPLAIPIFDSSIIMVCMCSPQLCMEQYTLG